MTRVRRAWLRWRRSRRSRLVYVVVRVPGYRIVASGLVPSETLRMLVVTTRQEMF